MNLLQTISKKVTRAANLVLNPIESLFAPHDFPREHAPVFIIGAPRSGSTLFYQLLVNHFDFGYLTNFHCQYYGFPYLAHKLAKPWIPKQFPYVEYKSEHGRTQGTWSPSECGEFWYRWFRRFPQYVSLEEANTRKMHDVRRVVSGLISVMQKPLLFKNMNCALRLRPLNVAFPEAVFLVISRDTLSCAESLLMTRKRVHNDFNKWWSMEPPNVEYLRTLSSEEQVIRQIRSIYSLIEKDAAVIGKDRFLYVCYQDLCTDVYATMRQVQNFLNGHDIHVNILRDNIPPSFEIKEHHQLDSGITQRLRSIIDES
jgi:hypothetical protein